MTVMAGGIDLPHYPMADALGFTHPPLFWPILMLTLLAYMHLTQITTRWLLQKHWI